MPYAETPDERHSGLWIPPGSLREDVAPRLLYIPTYQSSAGVEAIELAESAGLILDAWQKYVLMHALGEERRGGAYRWAAFQVALIVARQNGKGAILEALELACLFLFGDRLIGHSAHEYRTAMEAFRRVVSLIENTDDLRRKVKKIINTNGEEGVELLNGQRLKFLARSKGAGRGFSFDKLIWDEAYALTEDQTDAQMPTLSARPNPQIWLTSSPPLDPVSGEVLFRLRRKMLAGTLTSTAFMDYGAAGSLDNLESINLDDRALWRATNPGVAAGRITMEAIERERGSLSDEGFARERLCIWPADLGQGFTIIGEQAWTDAHDAESKPGLRLALAVSVSSRGRAAVTTSIGLASYRADGLVHVEVIETGLGTAWAVPSLSRLAKRWKPCAIVIDPGSPAGSLIADAEAAGLEIVKTGARDVAQAYGMFVDGVAGPVKGARNVRHLNQPELTLSVKDADNRPLGDGHAWDARAMGDITPTISVTNALWGLAVHGQAAPAATPWVIYA